MNKIFSILFVLFLSFVSFELNAQVGINNTGITGSGSAMLDLVSTDKGLLIPRISETARDIIPTPATGLLIYNTTSNHYNYFSGSTWYEIETTFASNVTGTNSPGGGISISVNPDKLPDNSAMLDASDPTRGVLIPRTTSESIPVPENGLIIYDVSTNLLKYYYDQIWFPICALSLNVPGAQGNQDSKGVAINLTGASPHPSAILDVTSSNKGILIPRLTSAERDVMLPVPGLTIFNITSKTIEYYNGSEWVSMNIMLAARVTIAANSNPVCAGTEVTFLANAINGGLAPSYQWKKNGLEVSGATNTSFTYVPESNDLVTCVLTSSAPCITGNPATSNSITMHVDPLQPVSIQIEATATMVCSGTQVTFTATPTNGGTAPAYQWKKGGTDITGATDATYTYVPDNDDAISCVLTSSATCPTGNPATSNTIIMTVNLLEPVSVLISSLSTTVCAGINVTFTATPVNGGLAPAYQWLVNGTDIAGATNSSYSYAPVNNDAISCVLTSNATCPTGNPATSNMVTMTVNPLEPVSVLISASDNPVCAGNMVTFTTTPTNGGNPDYQWKKGGNDIIGATDAIYSYFPANNDEITCVMTSHATCPTGNPATSNTVTMAVNPLLPVSIVVVASNNPVCAQTPVTFTATPTNGGANPAYQWKKDGTVIPGATDATYEYIPINNDAITCELTSGAPCPTGNPATSNTIIMTVNPLEPVSVLITASDNPVCAGNLVTFTTTTTNGGNPDYQWKKGGNDIIGATDATYSYFPANNDEITCVLTSHATCPTGNPAISNTIVMTVNALEPVSVSIVESNNPVCAGALVIFTATPVNGGEPAYQWKKNGTEISGATNETYSYNPLNNEVITCVMTSNTTCPTGNPATSNAIVMTVNPLEPVGVSIATTTNPVCAEIPVTFIATSTNSGAAPSYQWKKGGNEIPGATNTSYTYVPDNNDAITCVLTSSVTCPIGNPAISNTIIMTVNPLEPVSVQIAETKNPVCATTQVTFTATPVNGGSMPAYQWMVNSSSVPGATNATYTYDPVNNDAIICVLTSNSTCPTGNPATSNTITMIVNPLEPVSVSVVESDNSVCAFTPVTFTATQNNGGTAPVYQWRKGGTDIPGATNVTYTYVPVNNDAITCILTSNAICPTGNPATSNTVTMTVNPLEPVSVSITPSNNPVCAGTSVDFLATPVNGGLTPAYQWLVNDTIVQGATNASYSYAPRNNDAIYCKLTSNAICPTGNPAISNTVTMTVNPLLPVSITIASSINNVCAGTPVSFTSTIVNGGQSPEYHWKLNGTDIDGATNATYTYAPGNGDVITCMLFSNAVCPTGNPALSNTVTMVVNPLLPVSITVAPSANPICPGTLVTFTSSIVNGGTAPTYQWKVNGMAVTGATNTTYAYNISNNDLITCVLTSNALCAVGTPATSNIVAMTVNPYHPAGVTIAASAVVSGSPVTFTASPVNGGSLPVYQWKVNSVIVGTNSPTYTYTPVANDQVSCVMTSNATCVTGSPAISNTIIITAAPAAVSITIASSANSVCSGTSVTLTATTVNGGTTPAYQWKKDGTSISGATNATYTYVPANGNAITCALTSASVISNVITMSVIPNVPVSVSIVASVYAVMPGTTVTFTATTANQGTAPVYQWKVNSVVVGTNSPTYTYTPADHDKITCIVTSNSNAVCLTNNPATSNTIILIVYMTGSPCANVPTVVYGGLTYNTVQIGTQCWLRENLNIGTRINGNLNQTNVPPNTIEKYCYSDNDMNCNVYGGLYQWAEMVQYLNGATNTTNWNPVPSGNVQGICPSGWHIPTNAEWATLTSNLGGSSVAGGKVKETSTSHFNSPNTGATNSSGYTALPGGLRWSTGLFYYIGNDANYWTTTTGADASSIYFGGATYGTASMNNGQFYKVTGLSVRCLKN